MEETVNHMLPPRAIFLGSYPPRECGIATFTKDMVDAYDRAFGFKSPVIAIDEPGAEVRRYGPDVVGRIAEEKRESYAAAARFVNDYPVDLVNVQHEYGLFGGERGEWLVDFLRAVRQARSPDAAHRAARARRSVSPRDARPLRTRIEGRLALRHRARPARKRSTASIRSCSKSIHHGVPDVPFSRHVRREGLVRHRPAHRHLRRSA